MSRPRRATCGADTTYTAADVRRFWSKVDRSGGPSACWPWTGRCDRDGYGIFALHSKGHRANRVAWLFARGPIPAGLGALHDCDTPPCCNPSHLWLGTDADNVADRQAKGRQMRGDRHHYRRNPDLIPRGVRNGAFTHPESVKRGSTHGRARLTEQDVVTIRALHAAGDLTRQQIADLYPVSINTLKHLLARHTWRHVP